MTRIFVASVVVACLAAFFVAPLAVFANAPLPPDYTANVQRRIKRSWFPPRGEETKVIVVDFTIKSTGALTGLKLWQSSGSKAADKAALKAVENAGPFDPLPNNRLPAVSFSFRFDYNVFSGTRPGLSALKADGSHAAPAPPAHSKSVPAGAKWK